MRVECNETSEWRWSIHWSGWKQMIWFQFTMTVMPFALLACVFGIMVCYAKHPKRTYSFIDEALKNQSL